MLDYAAALNAEIKDMFHAGADIVQLDDPWMQARPEKAQAYGLKALDRALDGVTGTTAVHLCFGYAQMVKNKPAGYSFLPELDRSPARQVLADSAQGLRRDAEVMPIRRVPRRREIGGGQLARQQGALQLEADEDVQVVRHLVGLHADERRLDGVDGEMKRVDLHPAERFAKDLPGTREEVTPEPATAADGVLPQPRLRFVQPQRRDLTHGGTVIRGIQPLLVQTMASFVQRHKQCIAELVGVVADSEAAVAWSDEAGEGVNRRVEPTAVEVETDRSRYGLAKELLLPDRKLSLNGCRSVRPTDEGARQRAQFAP